MYQKGITHQGIEAVKYEQQFAKDQTDYLTEDYLTGQLQKVQQMNLALESDDGFLTAQDESGSLFMYLMNSYSDIHNTQYEYDRLNELDLSNGADFYERRIQKLTDYLNLYHEEGNYNDAEKDYWISHAKSVTTPFKWGSTIVVEFYRNVLGLGFYLMLVITICVASVEIPYSMMMGQLMLLQLLASFAMIILTGGLILALTTVRLVDLKQCLYQFMDYRIGSHVVGLIPVSISTHFVVGIFSLAICRFLWLRRTIR